MTPGLGRMGVLGINMCNKNVNSVFQNINNRTKINSVQSSCCQCSQLNGHVSFNYPNGHNNNTLCGSSQYSVGYLNNRGINTQSVGDFVGTTSVLIIMATSFQISIQTIISGVCSLRVLIWYLSIQMQGTH